MSYNFLRFCCAVQCMSTMIMTCQILPNHQMQKYSNYNSMIAIHLLGGMRTLLIAIRVSNKYQFLHSPWTFPLLPNCGWLIAQKKTIRVDSCGWRNCSYMWSIQGAPINYSSEAFLKQESLGPHSLPDSLWPVAESWMINVPTTLLVLRQESLAKSLGYGFDISNLANNLSEKITSLMEKERTFLKKGLPMALMTMQ